MSFFGDLVNSIGSDKPPAPPVKPPSRPAIASTVQNGTDLSKPVSRLGLHPAPMPLNGTKRKAEDDSSRPPDKIAKPNPGSAVPNSANRRPTAPPLNAPRPQSDKTPAQPSPQVGRPTTSVNPSLTKSPATAAPNAAAKLPAKGSYADIMARAKAAQEQRAQNPQNQVGTIKHQVSHREKISKIAERRREEQDRAKAEKEKSDPRSGSHARVSKRSASPTKKSDQPRVAKAPRPPLHAPQSTYKGTMGKAASRPRLSEREGSRRKSRYDEYLGTDEEENSDVMDDEEEDYGSDVSSDMEAGVFDMDQEEARALRQAREEDAKELALEAQLKREKEERRKRLQGLANKRK